MIETIIFPWTMFSFSLGFVLLMLAGLVIWIWALVDCLKSDLPDGDKIIWILVIVLFHLFGAIIYLIVAKSGAVKDMKITNQKKGKRLYRDTDNQVLAGVSSGMADYFSIDVVIIRLIWVVLGLMSAGTAVIAYIIAAIIIPEEPKIKERKEQTEKQEGKRTTTKKTTATKKSSSKKKTTKKASSKR